MDAAWDMDRPSGFWIKQTLADGKEMALKVLHASDDGQAIPGMTITEPNAANIRTNPRTAGKP